MFASEAYPPFSMFQLTYIVASPIVAMNLKKMGRKNSVVWGYLFMVRQYFPFKQALDYCHNWLWNSCLHHSYSRIATNAFKLQ